MFCFLMHGSKTLFNALIRLCASIPAFIMNMFHLRLHRQSSFLLQNNLIFLQHFSTAHALNANHSIDYKQYLSIFVFILSLFWYFMIPSTLLFNPTKDGIRIMHLCCSIEYIRMWLCVFVCERTLNIFRFVIRLRMDNQRNLFNCKVIVWSQWNAFAKINKTIRRSLTSYWVGDVHPTHILLLSRWI